MVDESRAQRAPSDAARTSRKQRRAEKRGLHEAQKKAKTIDRANDKRYKAANRQEKKAGKNMDMAQKKTDKGKTEKAQKKVDKAARLRGGNRH